MDYTRVCYKTDMRLWRDSDVLTPVYWHRCRPNAKVFRKLCSFRSNHTYLRSQGYPEGAVGEQHRFTYYKGQNPAGYTGARHCGTDEAMMAGGVHGVDEEMLTGLHGMLPCCDAEPPITICGFDWPERFLLDNGIVPHCPCVSGSAWELVYRGFNVPVPAPANTHVWSTNAAFYQVGVGSGEPPADVPYWGTCNYAPPIDAPSRVEFWWYVVPETCQAQLLIHQFWWKPDVSSGVLYGSSPVTIDEPTDLPVTLPAITTMHGASCGDSTGGGNPIVYTLTPLD